MLEEDRSRQSATTSGRTDSSKLIAKILIEPIWKINLCLVRRIYVECIWEFFLISNAIVVKTNSCQVPHTQYIISGRIKLVIDDGTEKEYCSGDAAVIPPGHDAWN